MARLFSWLILLAVIGVLALPFALLEQQPRVTAEVRLNAPQVARARALLAEHDPRRLRDGDIKALELRADELQLVLSYVLDQLGGGVSQVTLRAQTLSALLTWRLPANPLGRYLNLDFVLNETPSIPTIASLRIGHLAIPGVLAEPVLAAAFKLGYARTGLPTPASLLKQVEFADSGITLHYQWHNAIVAAVRKQLVPVADAGRLHDFQLKLVALTRQTGRKMTLSELAAPLFAFGVERAAQGDPVADNRVALLVLSTYVSNQRLAALAPAAVDWPTPPRLTIKVHGRNDLVKHFLNSAALAATGGQAVAKTVGLFKEINDSRSGSGFSFIDLLADEAGTRFGQRATESRVLAREIQQRAAHASRDLDWIPAPTGLEEQMPEVEFEQRYGGVEGAAYRAVVRDIQQRIKTSALYR